MKKQEVVTTTYETVWLCGETFCGKEYATQEEAAKCFHKRPRPHRRWRCECGHLNGFFLQYCSAGGIYKKCGKKRVN